MAVQPAQPPAAAPPAPKKATKLGTSKAAAHERKARFADAFIANGENAVRAYLAVNPGVTYNTAATEGHRLLKDPQVRKIVEARRAVLRERFSLTTDRVMQEQARVSYFNPKNLVDKNGKVIPLHQLDDDTAAALASVELVTVTTKGSGKNRVVTRKVTKAKPYNKVSALEKSIKILRLYDKPPPPPPDAQGVVQDPRETARRMAFLLAKGAAAEAQPEKPKPTVRPKKLNLAT